MRSFGSSSPAARLLAMTATRATITQILNGVRVGKAA
jgi:hypothetical protein